MAYQLAYTDARTGTVYPNSVWLPLNILPVFDGPYGKITFFGYATAEIAAANLRAVLGGQRYQPVATRDYDVSADQMPQLAMRPGTTDKLLNTLSAVAYEVQTATNDVPTPTEQDPAHKTNFFAGATVVDVLPTGN